MSDQIALTIPRDISDRARQIAETTEQPVEQVLPKNRRKPLPLGMRRMPQMQCCNQTRYIRCRPISEMQETVDSSL